MLMGLKQIWYVAIVVVVALSVLAVTTFVLNFALDETENVKDVVEILQLFVVASAIIIGGFFALFKFQVFRDFEPHLTVTHKISHRFIGDEYTHVEVTATLHNGSKVKIEVRKSLFRIQQIAPVSEEEISEIYSQTFVDREQDYLQWPTLEEVVRNWEANELIVEPGESHHETYEFIVSREVTSAMVYTYFYNSRYPKSPSEGWGASTVDDIMPYG